MAPDLGVAGTWDAMPGAPTPPSPPPRAPEPPRRPEEREPETGDRRAAIVVLAVLLIGLLVGLFLVLRGNDDTHPLAGAPYVTNFVAGWRPDDQATVWDVDAVDPQGDTLTYRWLPQVNGCGTFTSDGPEAIWTHPAGAGDTCARSGTSADGGLKGSVTVIISDGTFECTVTSDGGSGVGSMAYPATCVRIPAQ